MEAYQQMVLYMWAAAALCYIDRTNMSVAMIPAAEQHGWTKAEQGVIFSGFFLGYATTQILGGVLSVRYGGPIIVAVAVVMWSFFTLATPVAARMGFSQLMLARIGLGMGEGLAIPAAHTVAALWYPPASQARCISFVNMGHQVGTVIAMLLAPAIAADWEIVFYILGAVGFVWAAIFALFPPPNAFAPPPQKKAEHATPTPWRQLFTHKPCWAIYLSHFSTNVGFYMLITWLPAYFNQALGVPLREIASYTVPAYVAGACAMVGAGNLTDFMLVHGWDRLFVRKFAMAVAMLGCASCLLTCILLPRPLATPVVISVVMCFAMSCHGFHHSGNITNMLDVAPDHAGLVQGCSNTIATFAGVLGNLYVGHMLPEIGWSGVFGTAVCVYICGFCIYVTWASVAPQMTGSDSTGSKHTPTGGAAEPQQEVVVSVPLRSKTPGGRLARGPQLEVEV